MSLPIGFMVWPTSCFNVVIRGPAAAMFSTKGAEANMQLTFTFAAFE